MEKLCLVHSIEYLRHEQAILEQQLADLRSQIEISYSPNEVLFVVYETMNGTNAVINVFSYIGESESEDDGILYKSIAGDKLISFTRDFETPLCYEEGDSCYINAIPETFISFPEACIDLGSPFYLKKQVTALEINEILMQLRQKYEICIDKNGKWGFSKRTR